MKVIDDFELLTGLAELFIFHPVDTVAKRLMSNTAKVLTHSPHNPSPC